MSVASPSTDAAPNGPIVITFDGSVRAPAQHDNPSAAVGYTIEQMGSPIVMECARLAYWHSNTLVEYDALIAALEHAHELGFAGHVSIKGDAESVIEVIDKEKYPTPKSQLTHRYAEAVTDLLDEFESVSFQHVKRSKNQQADRLASDGHTAETVIQP